MLSQWGSSAPLAFYNMFFPDELDPLRVGKGRWLEHVP